METEALETVQKNKLDTSVILLVLVKYFWIK